MVPLSVISDPLFLFLVVFFGLVLGLVLDIHSRRK